ncbi:hypothetical protein UT300018_24110 [Clostridium faecium]
MGSFFNINYSAAFINLNLVTSNKPLSVIFRAGITDNDKKDSVINGLNFNSQLPNLVSLTDYFE